jgi:hypothetical protein
VWVSGFCSKIILKNADRNYDKMIEIGERYFYNKKRKVLAKNHKFRIVEVIDQSEPFETRGVRSKNSCLKFFLNDINDPPEAILQNQIEAKPNLLDPKAADREVKNFKWKAVEVFHMRNIPELLDNLKGAEMEISEGTIIENKNLFLLEKLPCKISGISVENPGDPPGPKKGKKSSNPYSQFSKDDFQKPKGPPSGLANPNGNRGMASVSNNNGSNGNGQSNNISGKNNNTMMEEKPGIGPSGDQQFEFLTAPGLDMDFEVDSDLERELDNID